MAILKNGTRLTIILASMALLGLGSVYMWLNVDDKHASVSIVNPSSSTLSNLERAERKNNNKDSSYVLTNTSSISENEIEILSNKIAKEFDDPLIMRTSTAP